MKPNVIAPCLSLTIASDTESIDVCGTQYTPDMSAIFTCENGHEHIWHKRGNRYSTPTLSKRTIEVQETCCCCGAWDGVSVSQYEVTVCKTCGERVIPAYKEELTCESITGITTHFGSLTIEGWGIECGVEYDLSSLTTNLSGKIIITEMVPDVRDGKELVDCEFKSSGKIVTAV